MSQAYQDLPKPPDATGGVGMRLLIAFVLTVSVAIISMLVYLGLRLNERMNIAEQQRLAVEAIQAAGGTIWYDYQLDEDGEFAENPEEGGDEDLRDLFGTDFYNTPAMALGQEGCNDEIMPAFRRLKGLRWLFFWSSPITDEGVRHLTELALLEELQLSDTRITDAGLRSLRNLHQLKKLTLSRGDGVSGAGLENLTRLPQLRVLWLCNSPQLTDVGLLHVGKMRLLEEVNLFRNPAITDAGIAHLGGLTGIERFGVDSCPRISDAGCRTLAQLTNLEQLTLSRTNISSAGLSLLASLTKLKALILYECRLTDDAVPNLEKLTSLKHLRVWGSGLSFQAFTQLRAALPDCEIDYPSAQSAYAWASNRVLDSIPVRKQLGQGPELLDFEEVDWDALPDFAKRDWRVGDGPIEFTFPIFGPEGEVALGHYSGQVGAQRVESESLKVVDADGKPLDSWPQ